MEQQDYEKIEKLENEIEQLNAFYSNVVGDLKRQIAESAEDGAIKTALGISEREELKKVKKENEELKKELKRLENKLIDKNK